MGAFMISQCFQINSKRHRAQSIHVWRLLSIVISMNDFLNLMHCIALMLSLLMLVRNSSTTLRPSLLRRALKMHVAMDCRHPPIITQ